MENQPLSGMKVSIIQATRPTENQVRNYGWQTGADYSGDTRNCNRGNDLVPRADFQEREVCALSISGTSEGGTAYYVVATCD
jgi:hypothetical protein